MAYIDGFVIAVPTANKDKFRKHAKNIDSLFTKHGALHVIEAWGDDVPMGETTDFHRAVKAQGDETVVFSWVFWPDKATRDAGNKKIFAEMEAMDEAAMKMPFDGKRMIYGGFNVLVDIKP
ncbi:hypothetical protein GCM10007853_08700 [Algimonas ampicilliniresistens]|uniref:DUF1428 domain-containing protein n=1 Tax=Algimonas ampicilliniresistens TaxID=1298735 RepID=A0ABQ5V625_9PROT|nr:DUF1428 domain-containing protein [Algimonas ampicilliniresistens]GLQ22996.1 hypothetical protein GCM10007853_08700 [Algimonas ampicilliniresistens]